MADQQTDPWAQFNPQSAPSAPAPAFGGRPVIHEAPPQREPKTTYHTLAPQEVSQRGLNPTHAYQVSSEGAVTDLGDKSPKSEKTPQEAITGDLNADHVIRTIGTARQQIGAGHDTGNFFGSGTFQAIPFVGQNSANLKATLDGLQGSVINDTIAQLKQLSATGASGYGSLSETEATRLAGSVAALHQTQDAASLKANLDELERHYRSARAILAGEDPRDPKVAAKYGLAMPGPNNGQAGGGSSNQNGPHPLDPQQQQQFFDILHKQGPDVADAYIKQFGYSIKDKGAAGKSDAKGISYEPGSLGHSFEVGAGGVVKGLGDILGTVSNPFLSGVNAVFGTDYRPDMGSNLRDATGLPAPQSNTDSLISAINEGGTAALGFGGLAKSIAPYIGAGANAVGSAIESLGSAPLTDAAAGATGSAAAEGTRQAGGSPLLQTAAGLAGGAASLPVSSRVNALAMGSRELPSVVKAGQQEGVTVPRAMADPSLQQKVTAVGKTMTGGRMMQRDMANVGQQIEGRVKALGQNGDSLKPVIAGQRIQAAADRSIKQSGQQLGRRYDQLENATGGMKVTPAESLARTDELITRLSEMPNSNKGEISFLQDLRKDLSNDLSIGGLRRMRTKLRKSISKGDLTFGEDEANVLSIMDSASSDIANGLAKEGKGAIANQFKSVDGAYRERMDFIKGTLQKVVGKRGANLSGEKVFANLKALTSSRGDSMGFARIVHEMTPEEQLDIASTLADGLGKNPDGSFSTATLVKHIEAIPEATRSAIFGHDGAKSLRNIQELARSHKRVSNALGGSPTGVANDYRSFLLNTVVGLGASGATGSTMKGVAVAGTLMGAKVARDAMNARLLMSPKIQGWLRAAPKTNNAKAIDDHFARLKAIAVREPALAPDIKRLQEAILKAANENVTPSVAASQPDSADQH